MGSIFKDNRIILVLIINFSNFWVWRILKEDLVIAIFLILLSITLTIAVVLKEKAKLLSIIVTILFIIVTSLVMSSGFDERFKSTESNSLQKIRHGYLSHNLGLLYQNKFILNYYANIYPKLSTWQQNLAYSLDLNLYFFASHPREKTGFGEFEKYPFILLPFFVLGIIWTLFKNNKWITIYLISSAFISSFVNPRFSLGPVLFFPLINLFILVGIWQFIKILKHKKVGLYDF